MKTKGIVIFAVVLSLAGATALGYLGYSAAKIMFVEATGNQARAELVGQAPKDSMQGFEIFTQGNDAYNVGVNIYGDVIFADNDAAYAAVQETCARAIAEMRKQAPELGRFREGNIDSYYDYIWQINWDDVDQEVYYQRQFLSKFLEYYENGDPKQASNSTSTPANMTGAVANLLQQCDSTDMAFLKKEIKSIYDNNVAEMLITNKAIWLPTPIDNEAIINATLSEPLPIFGPGARYKPGEDYKTKLKLYGWDIVVKNGDKPIAVFSIGKDLGEYIYQYTLGETYAITYEDARNRLKGDNALVLFLGEYFFLADDTDTVMPVLPLDETTGEPYPTRSFEALDAAVNKSINYYSNIDPNDLKMGGNEVLMHALYGENNL